MSPIRRDTSRRRCAQICQPLANLLTPGVKLGLRALPSRQHAPVVDSGAVGFSRRIPRFPEKSVYFGAGAKRTGAGVWAAQRGLKDEHSFGCLVHLKQGPRERLFRPSEVGQRGEAGTPKLGDRCFIWSLDGEQEATVVMVNT